jgi:3-oxoacyl-[acyl-carrier protein] reductase
MNTVIVSGSASGMGQATARHFAKRGWSVIGVDRSESDDTTVVADVTDRAGLDAGIRAALNHQERGHQERGGGTLKAVVSAAGIYPPTTLADYTDETYRRVFDVNVLGTLNLCAVTAPLLKAAGGGGIVTFASVDALAVSPGQLVYSASKAAVLSLTRSLAIELAPDGITVNGVAPGWVDTPGNAATGRMAGVAATIPLRRVADPAEIAHWVYQLAQGTYVTGETLVVSGGSVMR